MKKKSKCCGGFNRSCGDWTHPDDCGGDCTLCGKPFVPSQPNSEENCVCDFESVLPCDCKCHSPKPEEVKEAMEEFECVQTK